MTPIANAERLESADLWKRWFAFLLDSSLLAVAALALDGIVGSGTLALFVVWAIRIAICALYFPIFESSKLRATPGKLFFGLAVTDSEERRLSFRQAFVRNTARGTFVVPILIVYPCAYIAERMKIIESSSLLITGSVLFALALAGIQYFMAAVTTDRQTLYDLIARTFVVQHQYLTHTAYRRRRMVAVCFCVLVHHLAPAAPTRTPRAAQSETGHPAI